MDLEDVTLDEISQEQKDKYPGIALTRGPWSSQVHGYRRHNGGRLGEAGQWELVNG